MKINIKNGEKIDHIIEKVEKRCSARTIVYPEILGIIYDIEKVLSSTLYKKDWQGIVASIDIHAKKFPSSYRGTPESTQVIIMRGASSWFITDIFRGVTTNSDIQYRIKAPNKDNEILNFAKREKFNM